MERKTHREDWTGEKSVKARFPIKEHLVNAFLRGEYTMDAEMQALADSGKKGQSEVDAMIQLASEVQYRIFTRKLVPGKRHSKQVFLPWLMVRLQSCALFTIELRSNYPAILVCAFPLIPNLLWSGKTIGTGVYAPGTIGGALI